MYSIGLPADLIILLSSGSMEWTLIIQRKRYMFNLFRKTQPAENSEVSDRNAINNTLADIKRSSASLNQRLLSFKEDKRQVAAKLAPLKTRENELKEAISYARMAVDAAPGDARMSDLLSKAEREFAGNVKEQLKLEAEISRADESIEKLTPVANELKVALDDVTERLQMLDSRNESALALNRLIEAQDCLRSYEREVSVNEALTELRSPV